MAAVHQPAVLLLDAKRELRSVGCMAAPAGTYTVARLGTWALGLGPAFLGEVPPLSAGALMTETPQAS